MQWSALLSTWCHCVEFSRRGHTTRQVWSPCSPTSIDFFPREKNMVQWNCIPASPRLTSDIHSYCFKNRDTRHKATLDDLTPFQTPSSGARSHYFVDVLEQPFSRTISQPSLNLLSFRRLPLWSLLPATSCHFGCPDRDALAQGLRSLVFHHLTDRHCLQVKTRRRCASCLASRWAEVKGYCRLVQLYWACRDRLGSLRDRS